MLAQKGKGVVCNAILSLGTKFAKNISKPNFLLKMFFLRKSCQRREINYFWEMFIELSENSISWRFFISFTLLSLIGLFFIMIHHFKSFDTIVAPTSEIVLSDPHRVVSQNWLQWHSQASPQKIFFKIKIIYKTCSFIKKVSTRSLRKSRFYHDSTLFVTNSYVLKDQIPVIVITPLVLSSISTAWYRTRDRNQNPQYNL